MRCQLCKGFTPYEKTGLAELEQQLSKLAKFRCCGSGWTQNMSEHWACSDCIRQGRALPGDPSVQDCAGYAPTFFAHWDETKLCEYCGEHFVFTAGEKKFWYEELGFFTRSVPKGCQACRRVLRSRRAAHGKLGELLANLDNKDWSQLSELSELSGRRAARTRRWSIYVEPKIDAPNRRSRICSTGSENLNCVN